MGEFMIRADRPADPLEDKSIEDLDKMFDAVLDPDAEIAPEPTPEPEAPPAAPEPDATPPEPQAQDAEPDMDDAAIQAHEDRIAREKLQAEMAIQRAHSSRLAGEIGHLRQLLKTQPAPEQRYAPETPEELDRVTQLERTVEEFRSSQRRQEVAQAMIGALQPLEADPDNAPIQEQLKIVVPKYQEALIKAVQEIDDPVLARQFADAIKRSIVADAKEMQWNSRKASLQERRASTLAQNVKDKRAAAISASGAVPAPPPQAKSFSDMGSDELDAWLRTNVR